MNHTLETGLFVFFLSSNVVLVSPRWTIYTRKSSMLLFFPSNVVVLVFPRQTTHWKQSSICVFSSSNIVVLVFPRWTIHWKQSSIWSFMLPCHMGSPTVFRGFISIFGWVDVFVQGSCHGWCESQRNYAAHHNIFVYPQCSCWWDMSAHAKR